MEEKLESIKSRYLEVTEELMKPEVMNDFKTLKKLSKEQSDLKEIVNKYEEYLTCQKKIEEAKSLVEDPDFKEMAELEIEDNSKKIEEVKKE